jgi:hypothetical protein
MGKRWLCLIIWTASLGQLRAQDADSLLLTAPSDSVLSYSDSLSIFYLIDSLLTMEDYAPGSQLAVRLAYNSNVLYAGRTLGIDQFGLSPGVSYYHKTGLYADLSAFWSNDFDPKYYLTVVSAGYIHSFSPKFSLTANYDHYFYNLKDDYVPYTNGLTLSSVLDIKPITLQCDYTFYFGETYANRLMPSLGVNLEKKKFLGLDRISFNPTFYLLLGDQGFTNIIIPSTREEWIRAYLRMQQGLPWYRTETFREFGVMNYSISVPLNMYLKNFGLSVSYVYSIPKALPSETLSLPESGFLAASLTYYLNFKKASPSF